MSELMTGIRIGEQGGLANHGRKTREEMIAEYRRHAEWMKSQAEEVLRASDDDFIVEQFRGIHAQRDLVRIEPSAKAGAA